MELGRWLRALRTGRGLTASEVARRMDSQPPVITRIERGGDRLLWSTARRYIRACGVDPDSILPEIEVGEKGERL